MPSGSTGTRSIAWRPGQVGAQRDVAGGADGAALVLALRGAGGGVLALADAEAAMNGAPHT